ncbi:hypothetical protein IGI04_028457 [Brassica rapa subsp. trilocularis]|uniref:Uncharacterized protein n=1 Tax=Brassica rapa subsp. trilocularis TaxID=1813537 RepID=A0ABQ7L496_BRACM|nr:hypothetical protein IGI04_028457 [Brassica rapa subsp. trilocularis]
MSLRISLFLVKADVFSLSEAEPEFKDKSMGKRPVDDPQLEAGGGSSERTEHSGEEDDRTFSMIK